MFTKKPKTIDSVLAAFNSIIIALTEVRDAHVVEASKQEAAVDFAKAAALSSALEAKRADAILAKLTKLVA
jgi:hypothetical protein